MSMFRALTVAIGTLMILTGCIYIPRGWDELDKNKKLASIEVGETTKQVVLHIMGEPNQNTFQDSKSFVYTGGCSAGLLGFEGYYLPECGTLENKWTIKISFDENNIVSNIEK